MISDFLQRRRRGPKTTPSKTIRRRRLLNEKLESRNLLAASFNLQVLHASDLEGGVDAINNAPNFAAIVDAFETDSNYTSQYDGSILLSAGDNYIPGPFFNAAGDRTIFRDGGLFNDIYNDQFGTTEYDSLREVPGRVDISIMNILGFDASAIGNHEFDQGSDAFKSIIEEDFRGDPGPSGDRWVGAQFPYLSANLDFSGDNDLGNLFTEDVLENTAFASGPDESSAGITDIPKLAPSTVIVSGGEQIGVIGATTPLLESISSPTGTTVKGSGAGPNNMQALADILNPQIARLQRGFDDVAGNDDDVNKIILVSHLQQFSLEEDLIGRLNGVDIVIAGGSDTLNADANDRLRPGDTADRDYPVIETNLDGDPALLVSTAGEYSYVGRLIATFDHDGILTAPTSTEEAIGENIIGAYATDEEGTLDVTGETDLATAIANRNAATEVKKLTDAVAGIVEDQDGDIAGRAGVFLEGRREFVRTEETNMGNLTADANLVKAQLEDSSVVVSLKNGGGIRAEIGAIDGVTGELLPNQANPLSGKQAGEVSALDIDNTLRFNNGLTLVTVSPGELVEILEHGVSATAPGSTPGQFPQVGGISFSFDPSLPAGSRVQSLAITDELGNVIDPILDNGVLLGDPSRAIRMVTLSFLADGGDGYNFDPNGDGNDRVDTGIGEQAALTDYLGEKHSVVPYYSRETPIELDRRIQNLEHRADTVLNEVETNELPINLLSSVQFAGAEISAFDPTTGNIFVTSGDGLQVIDFNDPTSPSLIINIDATTITGTSFNNTEFTSVAVYTEAGTSVVAAALPNINPANEDDKTAPGDVLFFDGNGNFLTSYQVGSLPDMVTFVPGMDWLLVANEGESAGEENEPDADPNPNGSVSIIDIGDGIVSTFDFSDPSITFESLENKGVRVNRNAPSPAADLEPEYITIEGKTAFITLQENNAVAVIDDVTTFSGFTIDDILPLGLKDHTLPFNKLDPSNRDSGINIQNLPVFGMAMPDAIASYEVGGVTYFVTANEGDGRDVDETRIADYGTDGELSLDDDTLLFDADMQANENLGRLKSSNVDGDTDGDGDIDEINVFGARSFSIYDETGDLIYDSGDFFERQTAVQVPAIFNSDESDPAEFDDRSDDKGPEPEGVTLGEIDGQTYAFVGLERVGGIMMFNVTDPADVQFVEYLLVPGDAGPEGLTFITAADSPTFNPLLVISNEVSNTLTTIEFPSENPGVSYVDANNNQLFETGIDVALVQGELADGEFDTDEAEGGYDAVIPGAGLYVAAAPRFRFEIDFRAAGDLVVAAGVSLSAFKSVELNAGSDLDVTGAKLFGGKEVELKASGDIIGGEHTRLFAGKGVEVQAVGAISLDGASLMAGKEIAIESEQSGVSLVGSQLKAGKSIEIEAVDSVFASLAKMMAGKEVEIRSEEGDVDLQSASVRARKSIEVDAVQVLTDADTVLHARKVDIG